MDTQKGGISLRSFDQYFSHANVMLELCAYSEVNSYWRETNVHSLRNCIYYIIGGEGEICINGRALYPKAGDLVFIPYGAVVAYRPISADYYRKYWCHFQVNYNATPLFKLLDVPYITHIGTDAQDVISAFRDIMQTDDASPLSAFDRNAAMAKLLSVSLKKIGTENIHFNSEAPEDKLTALDAYIESHITERIAVDDLAQLVHFHPNYFIKFFTKYYGVPPHKYIIQKKLEHAKKLLTETDLSLEAIADILKYNSAFHFSSSFKKHTGFSPNTYRILDQNS